MKSNKNILKDLLIIGKVPPPIGGVTVHVYRLLEFLKGSKQFSFDFVNLDKKNIIKILLKNREFKIIHLHTSNPIVQLIFSIFLRFSKTKLIITYHGDLLRFNKYKTLLNKISIFLSNIPIVLNETSFNFSRRYNVHTIIISSFIPPIIEEKLDDNLLTKLLDFKKNNGALFATNAYSISYDKFNQEIYGIFDLIDCFSSKLRNFGLIISDPSGLYSKNIKENNIFISDNIFIIDFPHSFYKILNFADCSIRNTSTDGDSLSVKESLYLNKITFATDVVSRPAGTILYKRGNYEVFEKFNLLKKMVSYDGESIDGSIGLNELYKKNLK